MDTIAVGPGSALVRLGRQRSRWEAPPLHGSRIGARVSLLRSHPVVSSPWADTNQASASGFSCADWRRAVFSCGFRAPVVSQGSMSYE